MTIDGIRYVIDCGLAKVRQYMPTTGMDCLITSPIAKSESWQRTGRAGRQQPGVCYRLYPESTFSELRKSIVPEILRANLALVVLQLKSIGVNDIINFEWMSKPPATAIARALEQLYAMSALDTNGRLTPLGSQMVQFPLSPPYSRALIMSGSTQFACSAEMLSLVSVMSVDTIWVTPSATDKNKDRAVAAKRRFAHPDGDHLTLLNVYQSFVAISGQQTGGHNNKKEWCRDHYVNHRSLTKAVAVRKQLAQVFERTGLPVLTCGTNVEPLKRCLVSGLFLHAAKLQPDGRSYKPMATTNTAAAAAAPAPSVNRAGGTSSGDSSQVHIHPSSVLSARNPFPDCIVYNELVLTSKQYLRDCTVIDSRWLPELAPRVYGSESGSGSAGHKLRLSHAAQARLSSTDDASAELSSVGATLKALKQQRDSKSSVAAAAAAGGGGTVPTTSLTPAVKSAAAASPQKLSRQERRRLKRAATASAAGNKPNSVAAGGLSAAAGDDASGDE